MGAADAGHVDLRDREPRTRARYANAAKGRQHAAGADGRTIHNGDRRIGELSDRVLEPGHRRLAGLAGIRLRGLRLEIVDVRSRGEGLVERGPEQEATPVVAPGTLAGRAHDLTVKSEV